MSLHLIGATEDFPKLMQSPVAFPKLSSRRSRLSISWREGSAKIMASSAYRQVLRGPILPGRGVSMPSSSALSRRQWRGSMARMKSKGERGSPCRNPLRWSISRPELPFRTKAEEELARIVEIQSLHLALKPNLSSSWSRYSQETLLKALAMSSLQTWSNFIKFHFSQS